mgnify:CR=1 FL=1
MNRDGKKKLADFIALPIEHHLFPQLNEGSESGLGVTVEPGDVEVDVLCYDPDQNPVEITGDPLRTVRFDQGDFSVCVELTITKPARFTGKVAQLWFGENDTDLQVVRIVGTCNHVWEELDDGSAICFECDKRRPAEEGNA